MELPPLNVLYLEGEPTEAVLIAEQLRQAGVEPEIEIVHQESEMREFLLGSHGKKVDMILCASRRAELLGMATLRLIQERGLRIPIICLGGAPDMVTEGWGVWMEVAFLSDVARQIMRQNRTKVSLDSDEMAHELPSVSSMLLRSSVESAQEGVVIHDAAGRIIVFNKKFVEITGFDAGEVALSSWMEVADRIKRDVEDQCAWEELLDGRSASDPCVLEWRNKRLEVAVTSCLRAGRYEGRIWRFRDVTEREKGAEARRRLEQKLNQSQKMEALGVLAGGVAHDFNNLLAVILHNAELVRASLPPEEKAKHNMDNLLEALEQASVLVRQVLQFSHRDRQQQFREIDLAELLPVWAGDWQQERGCEAKLNLMIEPVSAIIRGDAKQLQQVLRNLCQNAMQVMPAEQGRLRIGLKKIVIGRVADAALSEAKPGEYALWEVEDNGTGMAPETLARIFEPFYTTKPAGAGVGLGLPVAYGVVKAHGGEIVATSKSGEGTTVRIYLPLLPRRRAQEAAVVARSTELPPRAGGRRATTGVRGRGERILLVDDDEAVASVTGEVLELMGFLPITFTDPREALAAFKSNPQMADLVLADVSMPEMDGVMLARQMLAARRNVPVLLLSGYSGPWTAEAVKLMGVAGMLSKPISADGLGRALREALDLGEWR